MKSANKSIGIGVGEDTALYINGDLVTCLGNDGVWIMDSSSADFNQNASTTFHVKNLSISYLTEGDTYIASTKEVTSTKPIIGSTSGKAHESKKIFEGPEGINAIKSLLLSNDQQSVGSTHESNPKVEVTFSKGASEFLSYSDESGTKFTVDNLRIDIGTAA
jgi:hypothetical protein